MQYKSYPTAKATPNRLARKHERMTVFIFNKKMAKKARKARMIARREAQGE